MYAIVEIGGMQWKAEESQILKVPKMEAEPGKSVTLDQVLLLVDKDDVQIGKPVLKDAQIQIKILSHGKDKKVMVFKKKRRKGYKVLRGHRQEFTEIQVEKIIAKTAKPAAIKAQAAKTAEKPGAETAKTKPEKAPAGTVKVSSTAVRRPAKTSAEKKAVPKTAAKSSTQKAASKSSTKAKAAPKRKAEPAPKKG